MHTLFIKPINMLKRKTYLVVLLLAVLFSACGNFFQKIGEDVSNGIDAKALTASVIETLNEEKTKAQLAEAIDYLISSSDTSINELLTQIEIDTLSKEVFQSFTTQLSESGLTDTLDEVLNELAVNLTTNLTDTLLAQLNSEQTNQQLQTFKANLLDEETTALISKSIQQIIVDLPLQSIADHRKYHKLVGILAGKIDEIPDQQVYDQLTTDIRSRAVEEGLEPTLKDVLNEYGLTASEAWKKRQMDS